jgi:hypothetical protein
LAYRKLRDSVQVRDALLRNASSGVHDPDFIGLRLREFCAAIPLASPLADSTPPINHVLHVLSMVANVKVCRVAA